MTVNPTETVFIYYCVELCNEQNCDRHFSLNHIVCLKNEKKTQQLRLLFNLKKELFSDIGPIKRARFIDKGLAEVIYVRIEHAKEAIQKYDLKELDGM